MTTYRGRRPPIRRPS